MRLAVFVSGTALFLSAALLFTAQLILARMLLPVFGGSAAVWNTAMVCYQAILLAGYTWSHLITRRLSFRLQVAAQALVLLVAALVVPFVLPSGSAVVSGVAPAVWLARLLFVMAGLPLFAVST